MFGGYTKGYTLQICEQVLHLADIWIRWSFEHLLRFDRLD